MTRFRSITLVVAIVLLAAGALTGIHLLNTSTAAPLPAQLSTSDAGGQPGTVPPVEQIPPAPDAPQTAQAPAGSTGSGAAPKSVPTNPAPAQRPATTQPDRPSGSGSSSDSGGGSGFDHDSDGGSNGGPDRWHGSGGPGQWHDPAGFPRRDQYPFRDRQPGFGGPGQGVGPGPGGPGPGVGPGPGGPGPGGPRPGFGGQQRPGQAPGEASGQGGLTPAQRDQARQQVANALCDRYHLPRERCQIDSTGR